MMRKKYNSTVILIVNMTRPHLNESKMKEKDINQFEKNVDEESFKDD